MDFKEVLDIHLKAIKDKAFDVFVATIGEDGVTLIMPDGRLISGREEFIELHKEWFSDGDWDFDYEILQLEGNREIAYALLKVDYKDRGPKGSQYSMNYYLTLIFKKSKGKWGLIYDQNTLFNNK
jgi:ketosteroid isomerase-like protein